MVGTSKWFALVVGILFLSGCASGVKRVEDKEKSAAYFAVNGRIASEVTLSLSKEAQALLADNLKFDQEKLLSTVRRALQAKGLLAKQPDDKLPKIEILITDLRVRSNFSAIMFGFMAGSDSVTGDVITRAVDGSELQRFNVSASYALGGIGGGQDDARMGWLYETFAKHAIDELTGAKTD